MAPFDRFVLFWLWFVLKKHYLLFSLSFLWIIFRLSQIFHFYWSFIYPFLVSFIAMWLARTYRFLVELGFDLWSTGTSKTPKYWYPYPFRVPVLHGYFKIHTGYSKNVPGTFEFMGTLLGTFLGTFGHICKVFRAPTISHGKKKLNLVAIIYKDTIW